MTVEPEVQALEIVKQLEALCNQAESAIKEIRRAVYEWRRQP